MIIFGILAMFRIICLLIVDGCKKNNNDCFMGTYHYYYNNIKIPRWYMYCIIVFLIKIIIYTITN